MAEESGSRYGQSVSLCTFSVSPTCILGGGGECSMLTKIASFSWIKQEKNLLYESCIP